MANRKPQRSKRAVRRASKGEGSHMGNYRRGIHRAERVGEVGGKLAVQGKRPGKRNDERSKSMPRKPAPARVLTHPAGPEQ